MTSREMGQVHLAKHIVDEREFERRYGAGAVFERRYGATALINFLIIGVFRAVRALVRLLWRALRRR